MHSGDNPDNRPPGRHPRRAGHMAPGTLPVLGRREGDFPGENGATGDIVLFAGKGHEDAS